MSEERGAGETLAAAARAALRPLAGLTAIHDGPPLQAASPYAIVEAGIEFDWSHKSGAGRDVRLTITLRDQGERPARLHRLATGVQAALDGFGPELEGWRLVTLAFVRSMIVAETAGRWAARLDYRARMLAD